MANSQKHTWTFEEDLYCCETCIQRFVVERSTMTIPELLTELSIHCPDISVRSLRMKISNIKQLLEENELENTLPIKPLGNYSQQNKRAFDIARTNLGI